MEGEEPFHVPRGSPNPEEKVIDFFTHYPHTEWHHRDSTNGAAIKTSIKTSAELRSEILAEMLLFSYKSGLISRSLLTASSVLHNPKQKAPQPKGGRQESGCIYQYILSCCTLPFRTIL